ncbi:MAG: hypothetical protein AAF737_04895 [Pseudomonadota bacterium]
MSVGKTEQDVGKCEQHVGGFDIDRFADLARSRFPTKTAAHLAAITSRTERCCERWLAQDTLPDANAIGRLTRHFGTAFLPVLARGVDWTARLAEAERRERLRAELAEIDGDL